MAMTTLSDRLRLKITASPDILAHLPLDRDARTPLHQQIYDGVRRAILGGSLRSGQRVPSTRTLAVELRVSRLPVLMAYEQLLHEGYLDGRVGSGTFVSATLPDDALRSLPLPGRAAPTAATRRQPRPTPRTQNDTALPPFSIALPALDRLPPPTWSRLVSRRV